MGADEWDSFAANPLSGSFVLNTAFHFKYLPFLSNNKSAGIGALVV
jgi:hypothetical protein